MKRILIRGSLAAILATALSATAAEVKLDPSKLPPPANKTDVTYAKDIKPLFEKTCNKCHGTEKQKGKLRLDSLEATLKGGEEGKILEAGKSEKSKVAYAVARVDEETAMPPKDKADPWTKEQVGLLRAWIDQGAK